MRQCDGVFFMNDMILSKSARIYIRKEKARIRREISDVQKQQEFIQGLYEKFSASKKKHGALIANNAAQEQKPTLSHS